MVFVVLPHHSYYRYFYPLTTVVMWLGTTKNRTFNAEKPPFGAVFLKKGGPSDRIRTCGILLPKQARYQLRYTRLLSYSIRLGVFSQTRRDTNFAIPGYLLFSMIPRRGVKIKFFLSVVIPVVKAAFMPLSAIGGNPANAGVSRLCGGLSCPAPDTATAHPNQARYQLRYTRILFQYTTAAGGREEKIFGLHK